METPWAAPVGFTEKLPQLVHTLTKHLAEKYALASGKRWPTFRIHQHPQGEHILLAA
jgi:hypothetical protein